MELLVFLMVALTTTSTTPPIEAKTSLAIVSDEEAWRESGFRVGLGYGYDSVIGLGGAPDGPHHALMVRLGARLDDDWSLFLGLRYGARLGERPGLRYSGTVEPTLHLNGLELTAGLGIAGFVIAQTGLEAYSAGNIVASYTVPDDRAQLSACSGAGVLGILRLEYPVPINDLLAIGPVLQVDAQWTRCTQTLGRSDPDTGEGIELHQYWGHYNIGLGWMTWWR